MRTFNLFTAALALFVAVPANAEEASSSNCSTTAYATVVSAYVYADIGQYARDTPALQSGVTYACESGLWFDVWNSTPLDLNVDGYDEETDFTVGYSASVGRLAVDASVSYYAIAPYKHSDDDMIMATVSVGVPIEVRGVTVTPYVNPFVWTGVQDFPTHTFVRTGASFSVPLSGKVTLSGDVSHVFNLTDRATSISERHVNRAELTITRDFGNGWTGMASAAKSGDTAVVWGLGFSKTF